jgi:sugar lactone lactonase YvrE
MVQSIASDADGNVFILADCRIWQLHAASNTLTPFAGTNTCGFEPGAVGRAASTPIWQPMNLRVDLEGRAVFAESSLHGESVRLRRVERDGNVVTLAGLGARESFCALDSPDCAQHAFVEVDARGRIYVSLVEQHSVVRVEQDGSITPVAGTGAAGDSGDGGDALLATLNEPRGMALDIDGRLYVADGQNGRIRRIDLDGRISTVAGGGERRDDAPAHPLESALATPNSVALRGNALLIADLDNNRIRALENDVIRTIAGTAPTPDGPRLIDTPETVRKPIDLAVRPQGDVLFASQASFFARQVNQDATVSLFAGVDEVPPPPVGTEGLALGIDQGDALAVNGATWDASAQRLVVATNAGLLVVEDERFHAILAGEALPLCEGLRSIRRVIARPDGRLVFARKFCPFVGELGLDGQVRQLVSTELLSSDPFDDVDIALAEDGAVLVSSEKRAQVFRVAPNGETTRVAGTGEKVRSVVGLDGPAVDAAFPVQVASPFSIALDREGRLLIGAAGSVFRVELDGALRTVAPLLDAGGAPRRGPKRMKANALAVGPEGTIYVHNDNVHQIWIARPDEGVFDHYAGNRELCFPLSLDGFSPAVDPCADGPMSFDLEGRGRADVFRPRGTRAHRDERSRAPRGERWHPDDVDGRRVRTRRRACIPCRAHRPSGAVVARCAWPAHRCVAAVTPVEAHRRRLP